MAKEIKKLLTDIHICIGNIEEYVGNNMKYEAYDKNYLLQDAVERNFITICEAVNLLLKIKEDIAISDARRIVNLRNRLTHGYDAVENTMVWNILVKYLPVLKAEVEELLSK